MKWLLIIVLGLAALGGSSYIVLETSSYYMTLYPVSVAVFMG